MALLTCRFYSSTLQRNTEIFAVLPTPEGKEQITDRNVLDEYQYAAGLPVVYLLHGAYGDAGSWIRNSSVERYAQARRCCAVTASCGNNFYQDMHLGDRYETFFTRELPGLVRSLFPASPDREKTFIAGFSMGGYGAWYLALRHPELYAKAASLSGALDIAETYRRTKSGDIDGPFPWERIFPDPEHLEGSGYDLLSLCGNCREAGSAPALYQACGTEDFLYSMNLAVRDRLAAMKADLTFRESPGGHDWDYWDREIRSVLDWMLL